MLFARIILCGLVVTLLGNAAHPSRHAFQQLIEQDGVLLLKAGDSTSRLSDAAHFEKIVSPAGRCYVLLSDNPRHTDVRVIECNDAGAVSSDRMVADATLNDATAIMEARRLPDSRMFVCLHVSPTRNVGVVINPRGGGHQIYAGYAFTWDRKGRHVAYLSEAPSPFADAQVTQVWVDGVRLADLSGDDAQLTWDEAGATLTVQNLDGSHPQTLILPRDEAAEAQP